MVKQKLGVKGLSFLLCVKGSGSLFSLMAIFSNASNCINGFININIALSDSSKSLINRYCYYTQLKNKI